MNALVLSAAALAYFPGDPTSVSTAADDAAWLSLDRDIASLSSVLTEDKAGPSISSYIKTSYENSDDFQTAGKDTSGFKFQNIRVTVKGKVGPMELKLSVDGQANSVGGAVTVKDAYGRWAFTDQIHGQMGQMKAPWLSSAVDSDDSLIFYDRSTQGSIWGQREPGAQVDGQHGPFAWYASAFNGGDGAGNDLLLFGRVAFAIAGDPIGMKQSGGYGTDSPTRVQVAAGVADEGTLSDGQVLMAEATAIVGPVYAEAEILDYGDDFTAGSVTQGIAARASGSADTTPWGVTAGFMFTAHDEAAVRYEDIDDTGDTTRIWLGYTRYITGHPCKVQVNWIGTDSDTTALDGDIFKIGLTVGV